MDVLLDGLVAHYDGMQFIDEKILIKILNVVITVSNETVTKKLFPIIHLKGRFSPKLFRYLRSMPSSNHHVSKLLQEMVRPYQTQLSEQIDIKLLIDHDLESIFMSFGPPYCLLWCRINMDNYALQAELINGKLSWAAPDFAGNTVNDKTGITNPNSEHPHQLYVICPFKPQSAIATMLIEQCQTKEDLQKLLSSHKFRYLAMAFGITVLEARLLPKV